MEELCLAMYYRFRRKPYNYTNLLNTILPHICHKLDTVLRIFFPNVLFIINTDGKLRQNS